MHMYVHTGMHLYKCEYQRRISHASLEASLSFIFLPLPSSSSFHPHVLLQTSSNLYELPHVCLLGLLSTLRQSHIYTSQPNIVRKSLTEKSFKKRQQTQYWEQYTRTMINIPREIKDIASMKQEQYATKRNNQRIRRALRN